jgi:hypothetical protein
MGQFGLKRLFLSVALFAVAFGVYRVANDLLLSSRFVSFASAVLTICSGLLATAALFILVAPKLRKTPQRPRI